MKIHLLLKKEDIDCNKMRNNKIAVVFDVLLATSTVVSALEFGAREVIPVLGGTAAEEESKGMEEGSFVLVGEYQGNTIDGFLSPNPLALKEKIQGKTIILSTTNGTVALKNSSEAKAVYAASILNSVAVGNHILKEYKDETIILVCSGSSNEFNLEDFFGAGCFIDSLLKQYKGKINLNDSAIASHKFYQTNKRDGADVLKASRVGKMLMRNGFEKEIDFISQEGVFTVIPKLKGNKYLISV
ncbi:MULTISPECIES: 2-phosphosulfolactate phosphatase [Cytobacillus]|uniref:2-phosphosulfolactate phosphatase n=1 Tax=Cytobacillus TaxID=2675230 RepID=UPI002040014B|nr:2-phosphosulfolactate phosphatase [Cytobacillus firmus]MCM3706493.1 2-phosphosulfolactate phosphatase [Cytobacillus firmus]